MCCGVCVFVSVLFILSVINVLERWQGVVFLSKSVSAHHVQSVCAHVMLPYSTFSETSGSGYPAQPVFECQWLSKLRDRVCLSLHPGTKLP